MIQTLKIIGLFVISGLFFGIIMALLHVVLYMKGLIVDEISSQSKILYISALLASFILAGIAIYERKKIFTFLIDATLLFIPAVLVYGYFHFLPHAFKSADENFNNTMTYPNSLSEIIYHKQKEEHILKELRIKESKENFAIFKDSLHYLKHSGCKKMENLSAKYIILTARCVKQSGLSCEVCLSR